jgi:C4-dicarboxylate transporter DctQ subunit
LNNRVKTASRSFGGFFTVIARLYLLLEKGLNYCSAAIIAFLMFFSTAEVISRRLGHPIPGHLEIVELILPAMMFLGLAHTQRAGRHIRIDLFLSKLKGRGYYLAEIFFLILSLGLFTFLTVTTGKNALAAYQGGDVSGVSYIPTYGFRFCLSIGCGFLSIRFAIQLVQNGLKLFGRTNRSEGG